jgi:thiol-disulfide isomerase/thioredoxin
MLNSPDLSFLPVQTMEDWADAMEQAIRESKPVYAFFWADWCEYCKKMAAETIENQTVASILKDNFVCCSLDTEIPDVTFLTENLGITELPGSLILNSDGNGLFFASGVLEPTKFEGILRDALRRFGLFSELKEKNQAYTDTLLDMLSFLEEQSGDQSDAEEKIDAYFESLSKEAFLDPINWTIMQELTISSDSLAFNKIKESLDQLVSYYGAPLVVDLLNKVLTDTVDLAILNEDGMLLARGLEEVFPILDGQFGDTMKELGMDTDILGLNLRFDYLFEMEDFAGIEKLAASTLETNDLTKKEAFARNLSIKAIESESSEIMAMAETWSSLALELNRDFNNEMVYGIVISSRGNADEALTYFRDLFEKYREVEEYREIIENTLDSLGNL